MGVCETTRRRRSDVLVGSGSVRLAVRQVRYWTWYIGLTRYYKDIIRFTIRGEYPLIVIVSVPSYLSRLTGPQLAVVL